jgi:signal transduction histidine kinase
MRNLPPIARLYLAALWACAALIGAAILPALQVAISNAPWLALVALIGVIIAGWAAVMVELQPGHRVSLTVHEALCMLYIPVFGVSGAWLFALGTAVVGLAQRRPWERTLFNSASYFLTYCCADAVYRLIQPPASVPFSGSTGLLAFVAVGAAYYASNLLFVSQMLALATRQPLARVYRDHLRQVSWVQLLTFTIGASMAALWTVEPTLIIYGVLTLLIAQRAFATVVALNAETRQRQELAEERAGLAEALQRQHAELARSARLAALGTFSAGIAHEFNNMLTAVIGHAQIGQLSSAIADKDQSLSVIARVSQHATSITNSLLTFSRQREPQLRLSSLQSAIDDTLALVAHDLRRDNVRLVQQIEDLPPVMCDPGQICQVLLNLITNARDALREQGGGAISLSLARDGDQALLSIADDGPGIAPEVLDKLFQPFVTTKANGNGLGMAICYGIIESHHGKITIASTLGKGTTVTIRLPLHGAELAVAEPALSEQAV